MCFNAQCSKTHGTRHKVLHNALYRFHLIDRSWSCRFLPSEEVTDEDRLFFLVNQFLPLLELLVRPQSCGYLKVGNRIRIPSMKNAVLAVRELSVVGQELVDFGWPECLFVQTDSIVCNILQSDAADSAYLRSEVSP